MKADRKRASASKDETCQRMIAACFAEVHRTLEAEMEYLEGGGDPEDAMRCALLLFEVFINEQRERLPRQEGRDSKKRKLAIKLHHDLALAAGDPSKLRQIKEEYMKKTSTGPDGMRKALQRAKKDYERRSQAARSYDCK
jgi:hypothetical protein